MKYTKFFLFLTLFFNQTCSAHIFSTVPSSFFDYVKDQKVVCALASGFALGALTVGCLWYYKSSKQDHPLSDYNGHFKLYKDKEKKLKEKEERPKSSKQKKLIVPYFFYESNCIDEDKKHLFIDFIQKEPSFTLHYTFKCVQENEYINANNVGKAVPIIFIRTESRWGDTIQLLNKKILDIEPIYILIQASMIESEYDKISYNRNWLQIACIQTYCSNGCKYTILDDEKNREFRWQIIQKIQEQYPHE